MGWLDRLFRREAKKEEAMHMGPVSQKLMAGMKMATDLVCGMEVYINKAAATSVNAGQTYYFCAVGCKKTFDENPAKYTEGGAHEMAGHSGHQM